MSELLRRLKVPETVLAAAIVPAAVVGIALPVDFLSQIDGYLIYLHPWELIPVFGWAWLFYFVLGSAGSLVAVLLAGSVAHLVGASPSRLAARTCIWIASSVAALAVIKGGKSWFDALGLDTIAWWLSRMKWGIVAATFASLAVWTWRRPETFEGVGRLAQIGAALGLVITLAAPILVLSYSDKEPPLASIRGGTRTSGSRSPDIVLLTIDALTATHMSLYSYPRPTTPELKQLAGHASVFTRFYANSNYTVPTVNSLINGVRPWEHRANQFLTPVRSNRALQGTVARLRFAGYQTAAVATNTAAAPFSNGNNRFFDAVAYGRTRMSWYVFYSFVGSFLPGAFNSSGLQLISEFCDLADRVLVYAGVWSPTDHFDPEIALSAARRLVEERDKSKPMFLWVHLLPPHAPYATPAPFIGRFNSGPQARSRFDSTPPEEFGASYDDEFPSGFAGRYDEAVTYVDHHVGQFAQWLRARGLFEDALVVITADHGESFTHGYGQHGGPLLHEDLIHIPLIIKKPGQSAGQRLDVLSEQVDLMPTILDLAGLQVKESTEGRSLKPALEGRAMSGMVFSMNFQESSKFGRLENGTIAAIEGRWKYIHYRGRIRSSQAPRLEDALYDLQNDPGESANLATIHPAIASRMLGAIEEQLRKHVRPRP